jgi:hypothetical protein
MIDDSSTLPVPTAAGRDPVSTVAQLADIPEEDTGSPSRRALAPAAPTG